MNGTHRTIEKFEESLGGDHGAADVIPLLQSAQEAYGYVPVNSMEAISKVTGVPVAEIYGVVTFYRQFRLTPQGKHVVKVCNGTACHVNGSPLLESTIEEVLGIRRDQTDKEGIFSVESVNCVGCCSLAPVVMVNDETYGSLTPRKLTALLKQIRKAEQSQANPPENQA